MSEAYICDFARTPIGRYGGALAGIRPDDLAAVPIAALLERHPRLDREAIGEIILGCANQAGEDNRNIARMAALLAGLPPSVPGVTVNRLCASGLEAVGQAARTIRAGEADLLIAGGVESMTRAPFVQGKASSPWSRQAEIYDTTIGWRFVNPALKAAHGVDSMPGTAENVADEFKILREDQDAFAARSQARAAEALKSGFFNAELVPVYAPNGRGSAKRVDCDEHPRGNTSVETLAALKPVVRADGTVTAGNASGVNDGAAALIISSESGIKRHGLTPRARILGMASAGVPPRIMGIGPVPATLKLLDRLGGDMAQFDWIELNEAFASQSLAVLRSLGLPDDADHVNPNGGAIALGHPLGMSGARLVMTAVNQLGTNGGKRALASLCVGVGQGLSLAIERV